MIASQKNPLDFISRSLMVTPLIETVRERQRLQRRRSVYMRNRLTLLTAFLVAGVTLGPSTFAAQDDKTRDRARSPEQRALRGIEREVRHELVMLPYYGVFDNLTFQVNGSTVTLGGQVSRPTLKSSAENVVKDIEGVDKVVNNIEVLPVSPNDDRIRLAVFRAIYGHTALNRYALQAVPPIHIIVRNGNVTLEGVVASEADKNIANIQARGVPNVFEVTNNLRVEERSE
jgi:hyperosmotically inducible periplasmic protein